MSRKLLVLIYEGSRTAEDELQELRDWEAKGRLTLEDLAVVSREAGQNVKVRQARTETAKCTADRHQSGLLGNLLFGDPLAGPVADTTIDALAASLKGHGVDDAFINKLTIYLKPGASALLLLGQAHETDRVLRVAHTHRLTALQTTLLT